MTLKSTLLDLLQNVIQAVGLLRGAGILYGSQEGTLWDLCEKMKSDCTAKYSASAKGDEDLAMDDQ